MADCCNSVPQACITQPIQPPPPQLTTDCFVVNSLVCTKEVQKVAELTVPATQLGVIVGPGGTITPLVRLEPDLESIVSRIILIRDKVINTGFVPVNIVIAGIELPLQLNLPFQEHTDCPGACPEDTVIETPLRPEAIIVQGIEALGIGVAQVVLKIILRTTITVVRPIIAKLPGIEPIQDVNIRRCEVFDVPTFPAASVNQLGVTPQSLQQQRQQNSLANNNGNNSNNSDGS